MAKAVIHNGEKFYTGKGWSDFRINAKIYETKAKAVEQTKKVGGIAYKVKAIVLEIDPKPKPKIVNVPHELTHAYIVWKHTSIDPGEVLGCFDELHEAEDEAKIAMNKIAEEIVRGDFIETIAYAPSVKCYENKWDDHISILKLEIQ